MMFRNVLIALCGLILVASPVLGSDLTDDSIPMKWIEPLLPEDLPALTYPDYFSKLDQARAQGFAGRYKLSLITLQKISDLKPDEQSEAAAIKARALAALGKFEQALAALSDAKVADDPDVQIEKAQVLLDLDQTDQAIALLKDLLKKDPHSIPAHYWLGGALEQAGDTAAAVEQYSWFTAPKQDYLRKWELHERLPVFDKAPQVTLIGQALDRWATLTSAYKNNANLDRTIFSFFVKSFDEIEREYYPARVAAAQYLLSHDQSEDALAQLKTALTANPNELSALGLTARITLEQFDFDNTDRLIAAIRKVDPESLQADLLDARNLMGQRRPQDAEGSIQKVLAKQPHNIEAMGLLAAVYALELKEDQSNEVLRQVERIDPRNASAYVEVAEQLDAMRQYPRAIAKYRVAIERAPWMTGALNGLGLLYTQSGDEEKARQVLEQAHQLDPFNLRTTHYLQLLDKMASYAKKESDHFIVMYDPQNDPVIPDYFSDYLESMQSQVCAAFNFTPKVKTQIEVFPTHAEFSVRTTGSTWLPTVGASTGSVIALVAPRPGSETMNTYNWARVLRHEFTHTVTLGATDNRIAHWFTEGLAVYEEQAPVPWEWVPMLYQAVSKKEFFPLDKLTWAFVRPRRPVDRQLAYAESFWICKYVEQTYGHDAILKMLDLMRNADRQEDVFPKVTGKSIPQFMTEFQSWAEQQVSTWGYDENSKKKYDELRKQGEDLITSKQYAEAAKVWEQIAQVRPVDALPHQKLAALYYVLKERQKEIGELELLSKVELKDNRYAKRIARAYRDTGDFAAAQRYALNAVYINPYDLPAHELLKEVSEKNKDTASARREDRVIGELHKLQERQDKEKAAANENP